MIPESVSREDVIEYYDKNRYELREFLNRDKVETDTGFPESINSKDICFNTTIEAMFHSRSEVINSLILQLDGRYVHYIGIAFGDDKPNQVLSFFHLSLLVTKAR